ncbi:RND family efflux transporter, MFP subunit [Tangfeifania diversioriginum]|uniref:RND family efflux transporter, MFP subunit n=1 Tax=Tangfeifania diversioriginum TaxID=1168035 RepID=A0A1M6MLJ7_9BACT|nr:efflux RND transporter periplasmic adaptor subunit [Tangfeifania diversioriginum]SHJ84348.1 RND family efflux transporter, MFP subunit [Tangfeifania diversioriginum]
MKTVKQISIALIILVLVGLAAYKLNANKEQIRETTELASQTISEIPVKIVAPQTGTINKQISTTGTVSATEELMVLSETQGKVQKIYKNVGDRVQKNEVIIEVDDEVIAANVLVAEADFEQQTKDIERLQRLEQGNAISKHDLEQARIALKKAEADLITARKALRDTKIKAPISGIINKRLVENGQFISGGMPICEIVNTAKLKIWVKIPEKDIFKLAKGQAVHVTIPSLPGKTFTGKLNSIGEKADNAMKFDAEVVMDNHNGEQRLKAGLFSEVLIPVEASETILIEKTAITGSMKNPSVFVVEGDKAVKKEIITNESDDKFVEVVSGLNKEGRVVVSGQLNLNDGDRVKIIQ